MQNLVSRGFQMINFKLVLLNPSVHLPPTTSIDRTFMYTHNLEIGFLIIFLWPYSTPVNKLSFLLTLTWLNSRSQQDLSLNVSHQTPQGSVIFWDGSLRVGWTAAALCTGRQNNFLAPQMRRQVQREEVMKEADWLLSPDPQPRCYPTWSHRKT